MELPSTNAEVAEFIGGNFSSWELRNEEDFYLVSAHDLISAFRDWQENKAPAPPTRLDVAESIKAMCATGELPDRFEDVADMVAEGVFPLEKDEIIAQQEVEIAGLNSSIGHLSRLIDELRASQPVAEQIKREANKTMRELEQSGLAPFQIDRLSGKVNGLMLAHEMAQTAQREPLTDAECDKVLDRAIGFVANKLDIPSEFLQTDIRRNGTLGRAIVRAAHGITAQQNPEITREAIIQMAREAGFAHSWSEAAGEALDRFAALVAQKGNAK